MKTGSSPLARGLRARRWVGAGRDRIIPARAGFTCRGSTTTSGTGDHPRSRGVYLGEREPDPRRRGSSPLARGLPELLEGPAVVNGIIPARAGFTESSREHSGNTADHPRSRGVYFCFVGRRSLLPGSSPLARGLRTASIELRDGPGIIPARAGFTPSQGPGL